MNNHECPNCGYVLGEHDKKCKYCGTTNPEYVEPKQNTSFIPMQTSQPAYGSVQTSNTNEAERTSKFSVGLFILLIFLFWPAAIIYLIANIGKK